MAKDHEIQAHPLVKALTGTDGRPKNHVCIRGFLGASDPENPVRLHSVDDLHVFYDIPRDDVIHPCKDALPGCSAGENSEKPIDLYVKADAQIVCSRMVEASSIADTGGGFHPTGGGHHGT
jgi:hypothetical protein